MGSLKIGVASVTFRNKTVSQVVEIAKNAGVGAAQMRNKYWYINVFFAHSSPPKKIFGVSPITPKYYIIS